MTATIDPSGATGSPEDEQPTREASAVGAPVVRATPADDGFWVEPAATGDAEPSSQASDVDGTVARDAHDFGVYARTGGWAFALKVARSVRPGGQPAGETPKISAKRFAELAGCSPERVMRYYKAWDKAADDGLVPHFEILVPGQEVALPDSDAWLACYTARTSAASERVRPSPRPPRPRASGRPRRWRSPRIPPRCVPRSWPTPPPPGPRVPPFSTGSGRTRSCRPSSPVTSPGRTG